MISTEGGIPTGRSTVVTSELTAQSHARRVSWGSVVAGMVLAVVTQLVLSLLGAGIGLGTVDPLHYNTPDASSLGLGAGIWWVLSSVIALYIGGWVASHLSGSSDKTDAVLHGLLTWGVATLVTVYLLASLVTSVVSRGAAAVSKTASLAASGASAAAGPVGDFAKGQLASSGISLDSLKAQGQALLAQTGKSALQPGALMNQASSAGSQISTGAVNAGASSGSPTDDLQSTLQKIIASGKDTVDQVDRDSVVNVVMARTGLSRPEAELRADAWIKQYQDARAQYQQAKVDAEAKARQVADAAASASSKAALGTVFALVLGAIAAAYGGLLARRRDVVVSGHRTALR